MRRLLQAQPCVYTWNLIAEASPQLEENNVQSNPILSPRGLLEAEAEINEAKYSALKKDYPQMSSGEHILPPLPVEGCMCTGSSNPGGSIPLYNPTTLQ